MIHITNRQLFLMLVHAPNRGSLPSKPIFDSTQGWDVGVHVTDKLSITFDIDFLGLEETVVAWNQYKEMCEEDDVDEPLTASELLSRALFEGVSSIHERYWDRFEEIPDESDEDETGL